MHCRVSIDETQDVPAGYAAAFPGELRPLTGAAQGVLLAQQTAANLHAGPGDAISIGRAGLPAVQVRVDGVVDLPQADSLFQKVGAPSGSQPQAPPDNVVLLDEAVWHQAFDPLAASRPDLVRNQAHVRLRHDLPADPAHQHQLHHPNDKNFYVNNKLTNSTSSDKGGDQ